MAKKGSSDFGSGPEEVRVTIVVEKGRVRAALTKLQARVPVRAGLVSVLLIAAAIAGAIIVASLGGGRAPGSSSGSSPRPPGSGTLATQFGLRLNCARLTAVLPDGTYARIDLDHSGPCGTFGNQVTLILHRVDGRWVREFEASSWTCPIRQLPEAVATELRLCGRIVVPSRPAPRSPSGVI
jgi:hypothetical protein